MIRTDRLVLRHARPGDLAELHTVFSDPVPMRWWSTLPHTTLDETRTWLDGMIAGNTEGSDDYIIERDGTAIGKAGFYRMPDIGYILHPNHQRQGLAFEALTAVIAHVFAIRPVETLTADVDPENAASIRLLERLGFQKTGSADRTWNIGGDWKDSFYYGLTRADWTHRINSGS